MDLNSDELGKMANLENENWWHLAKNDMIGRVLGLGTKRPLLEKNRKILEVGPGGGGLARMLFGKVEYFGVEADGKMAERLKRQGFAVVKGDAERLDFEDSSFDAYLAFDVLEHIGDDRKALSEAHRVLRKGGVLVASVPVCRRMFSSHDVALGHKRRYERAEILGKIKEAGFEVIESFFWNSLLFPAVFVKRSLGNGACGKKAESDLARLPGPVNAAMLSLMKFENAISRHLKFPWGLSVFVIARKKAG